MGSDRALLIGNSRWHWVERHGATLNVEHGAPDPARLGSDPPVWAAVGPVPDQLLPHEQRRIRLHDVPLQGCPPWLGVDRAIGAWQAWKASCARQLDLRHGLVLADAGTVLSLTNLSSQGVFTGGLLVPGYRLQLQAMAQGTQALPELTGWPVGDAVFPMQTDAAMRRGVMLALTAVVLEVQRIRAAPIWICGGDGPQLAEALRERGLTVHLNENLQLEGLAALADDIKRDPDR